MPGAVLSQAMLAHMAAVIMMHANITKPGAYRQRWVLPLTVCCLHSYPPSQTCSFELVTDPPRPVGGNNWIFFFRCLNGNLPAGYNNTLPICYRNYYTGAPCGGNDVEPKTFLRDTYTLDKLGNQAFAGNFATDPNVPASRLRALFGANAWGIQSPDGAPCTFTFAVAPLPPRPDGFTGSDEELCKRKEATDSDWTPVGSTVEMRESANAGVSTASITQPSSTSITGFSGTSQTFTIQVTNPVKSCCQLPPPTVVSSPAGIVACSAPPSGTNGWFAPNAADNTCELSFSCSLVAAGSAIVNITQSNWDASATLVQQEITVNVQTTTFAITPSSTSLSRISGTSQLFNVTVSNLPLTRTCSGLQLPTFVVTNPAVATCSIAGGATAYSADNGGPCTLGISCSFTSSAGTTSTTSITITAGDGSSNPVATQTTTVFVVSRRGGGKGEGGGAYSQLMRALLCPWTYGMAAPTVSQCLACSTSIRLTHNGCVHDFAPSSHHCMHTDKTLREQCHHLLPLQPSDNVCG